MIFLSFFLSLPPGSPILSGPPATWSFRMSGKKNNADDSKRERGGMKENIQKSIKGAGVMR
jgi:hypothetical protein